MIKFKKTEFESFCSMLDVLKNMVDDLYINNGIICQTGKVKYFLIHSDIKDFVSETDNEKYVILSLKNKSDIISEFTPEDDTHSVFFDIIGESDGLKVWNSENMNTHIMLRMPGLNDEAGVMVDPSTFAGLYDPDKPLLNLNEYSNHINKIKKVADITNSAAADFIFDQNTGKCTIRVIGESQGSDMLKITGLDYTMENCPFFAEGKRYSVPIAIDFLNAVKSSDISWTIYASKEYEDFLLSRIIVEKDGFKVTFYQLTDIDDYSEDLEDM